MNFDEIKALESKYIVHSYGRTDISLVKGNGATLVDSEGKEYIDMTSGIGVSSLGYNYPALVSALQKQVGELMHCSNIFYSEPMVHVAKNLVESTGLRKVFFANSGAEANEGMLKVARKYSSDKYGNNRYKVLSLKQSFHGRTMVTLKATGQEKFHQYFYPFPEGFDYVEANNFQDFVDHCDDTVCAVIMEMVQGEGGVLPLNKDFVKQVSEYCQSKDILVCIDEVQTGIGRTGSLFAYQQFGIQPDIVSMAKGLAGGVPIGGFIVGEKCADTLQPGMHGTTFGGNLLATTAANVVLSVVNNEEFLKSVQEKGEYIQNAIHSLHSDKVKTVRGMGLMLGIIVDPEKRAEYMNEMREKGVLVLSAGSDAIRLLPPLTISYEELDKALDVIKGVLA